MHSNISTQLLRCDILCYVTYKVVPSDLRSNVFSVFILSSVEECSASSPGVLQVTHDWEQLNKNKPLWMRKAEEVTTEESAYLAHYVLCTGRASRSNLGAVLTLVLQFRD